MAISMKILLNMLLAVVRRNAVCLTSSTSLPPAPATIDEFEMSSANDIDNIINEAPIKSCDLDPLSTHVVKEFLTEPISYVTYAGNASLAEGTPTVKPAPRNHNAAAEEK